MVASFRFSCGFQTIPVVGKELRELPLITLSHRWLEFHWLDPLVDIKALDMKTCHLACAIGFHFWSPFQPIHGGMFRLAGIS